MREVLSKKLYMRGAVCSIDHYLVRSLLRLKVSLIRRKTRSAAPKKLGTSMLVLNGHAPEDFCLCNGVSLTGVKQQQSH